MNRWVLLFLVALVATLGAFYILPRIFYNDGRPTVQTEQVIRGAIDIGSGTTNLKVAAINPKTSQIINIIFQKTVPVAYQKQLELSNNGNFDEHTIKASIESIETLKNLSQSYGAEKTIAVATAAFRAANNGKELARMIEEKTGVPVRIINQDEEGILAFRGAIAKSHVKPDDAVVWDIGGGSMQFTTLADQGTYLIEHGKLASIPFKNMIIENIKNQDLQSVSSPNPLNIQQIEKSLLISKEKARLTSPFFKEKINEAGVSVLAVGNLFNLGIRPLVADSQVMTKGQLRKAVFQLANKSDTAFKGHHMPEVALSNPLLVLGYMDELGIESLRFVEVNNADGALTYPAYWS